MNLDDVVKDNEMRSAQIDSEIAALQTRIDALAAEKAQLDSDSEDVKAFISSRAAASGRRTP